MVLSPQCFHNLRLSCDIFNHANVHFWEYMQPGYDALGFISCTGTTPCLLPLRSTPRLCCPCRRLCAICCAWRAASYRYLNLLCGRSYSPANNG